MMRVLVTGAAGYLGCVVTEALLARGHGVMAVDTLERAGRGLRNFIGHSGFRFARHDIRTWNPIGADHIVHLAGVSGAAACAADPERARQLHVETTSRLMAYGAPLTYASTCSLFDTSENDYTRTKYDGEAVTLAGGGRALRFGTLCGPSGNTRYDLFLNDLVLRARTDVPMEVYEPHAMRPWLHVRDAAAWVVKAVEDPRNEINVLVGENLSKQGCVEHVRARFPGLRVTYKETGPDRRDYAPDGEPGQFRPVVGMIDDLLEAINLAGR